MVTTIREIAERAKVSLATVSLALNRKPGVSDDTRDRVLAAASELNYRSRKRHQESTIRTIRFLWIAKHGHIINPNHRVFIADYIDGLEWESRLHQCSIEVRSYEHFDPDEIFPSLDQGSIAGAIILGTELDDEDLKRFCAVRIPLGFIDTYHTSLDFDFVDMDNDSSVFAVVAYLHSQGHRRIGLVKGSVEIRNFRFRERAFLESLEQFGLSLDERDLFAIDSKFEQGRETMVKLLAGRKDLPTALFCVNDIVAYNCAQALKDSGFAIPEDVSLVGFDDLPSNAFMNPTLTSVKVSKHRIGQRAMQAMALRLQDPERPSEKTLVGGSLVLGGSVRALSAEDRPSLVAANDPAAGAP
jgi:DNA-binding LacI/PurR family transcriptional regulator